MILLFTGCKKEDAQPQKDEMLVSFTTSLVVGTEITLSVYNRGPFEIDFGDGELVEYGTSKNGYNFIENTVKGNNIKIYANNPNALDLIQLSDLKIISINVTNAKELRGLTINGNELQSIEVSQCIKLEYLNISDNLMNQAALDQLLGSLPIKNEDSVGSILVRKDSNKSDRNGRPTSKAIQLAKERFWDVYFHES